MTLREAQSLFTLNIGKLIAFAYEKGFELTCGEFFRTKYQQEFYVKNGFSKTMDSRHLVRLACDFNIFLNDRMLLAANIPKDQYIRELLIAKQLGDYWESLHPSNVWGGDWNRDNVLDERFKDPYHFEMKPPTI